MRRSRQLRSRQAIRRNVTLIGGIIFLITLLGVWVGGQHNARGKTPTERNEIKARNNLSAIPIPIHTGNLRRAAIFVLTITQRLIEAALVITRALRSTLESTR